MLRYGAAKHFLKWKDIGRLIEGEKQRKLRLSIYLFHWYMYIHVETESKQCIFNRGLDMGVLKAYSCRHNALFYSHSFAHSGYSYSAF